MALRKFKKKYARPIKLWDSERIKQENSMKESYGLKNKREIWKAQTFIDRIRQQAKKLIKNPEIQEDFFNRLLSLGLIKEKNIDAVLKLKIEDLLERRLQTILLRRKMAQTIKQARQLITHKKVFVGEKWVSSPSYIVKISEEDKIKVLAPKPKTVKK